jgi:hypothetical protein
LHGKQSDVVETMLLLLPVTLPVNATSNRTISHRCKDIWHFFFSVPGELRAS